MNIVKIKDIILTAENAPELSEEQRNLFNTYFRDKYVYALNWKYLIPFDDLSGVEFVEMSEDLCKDITELVTVIDPSENTGIVTEEHAEHQKLIHWMILAEVRDFVDIESTHKANRIVSFVEANKFSSDSDITMDEIKRFRTWLAETLYRILADDEEYEVVEMLNYYKEEMNDETIKHLTHFPVNSSVEVITATASSSCGCQNQASVDLGTLNACDPIYLYRKAVYEKMVETFSDISFWTERETEFIKEFKKYVDAIIHHNLPLVKSDYISDLYDCGCLSDADASQERLMQMLKNLSKALGFIADGDIAGKRNFIGDALNRWAAYLYERMRWY